MLRTCPAWTVPTLFSAHISSSLSSSGQLIFSVRCGKVGLWSSTIAYVTFQFEPGTSEMLLSTVHGDPWFPRTKCIFYDSGALGLRIRTEQRGVVLWERGPPPVTPYTATLRHLTSSPYFPACSPLSRLSTDCGRLKLRLCSPWYKNIILNRLETVKQ